MRAKGVRRREAVCVMGAGMQTLIVEHRPVTKR